MNKGYAIGLQSVVAPPLVRWAWIICYLLCLSGCTGLSKLADDQRMLVKNQVILTPSSDIENYRDVQQELLQEVKPTPNSRVLWMRPGPAIYNTIRAPRRNKGLRYWLKYKLGAPPVLLDTTMLNKLTLTFENRLYHRGYFLAHATAKVRKQRKTASVTYTIHAGPAYTIDTLLLPDATTPFTNSLMEIRAFSLIKKGSTYSLDLLKKERSRIETGLKDLGYYYFDADYLLFLADTTVGNQRVKLRLKLKNNIPEEALKKYKIDRIIVSEDFALQDYHPDTIPMGNYQVVSSNGYMRPKIFLNSVLFEKGDLYSQTKNNNSLRQLMSLQTYKFVNTRYNPASKDGYLDLAYFMTPASKMSISAEFNATTKSNNFAGPGMKISFKSKNSLRGAELFSLNLIGRYEKQISGEKQGDTAYEISVDGSLDLPRHIPFAIKKHNGPFLPYSKILVGTGIYARVSLYKFNSYSSGLQYSWRKNEAISHTFKPIDISVTNLIDASDEFMEFLKINPSIKKSFEEQFIVGTSYSFTLNKLDASYPSRYYVSAGADPSGNLVALFSKLTGHKNTGQDKITLFGNPVSQYFRLFTDLRYYFKTGRHSLLASRIYTGAGMPYGNSQVMPYIKQFYAGGTNSMRAFRARSLGPGSYTPPDSLKNVLVDQTGEIKIEGNLEYRFPVVGYLKGAVFTDIGNIWLVNDDSLRAGGKFNIHTFYKELAVGAGLGLRIDMNVAVIRLDWAFPLRKPWLPPGERWVLDEINLLDRQWRRNNLILNISIGYPF